MSIVADFNNPFERHGMDPGLMDVAALALMRGRRGEGLPVMVIKAEYPATIIEFDAADREIVASLVDNATGADAARSVGFGILAVIHSKTLF